MSSARPLPLSLLNSAQSERARCGAKTKQTQPLAVAYHTQLAAAVRLLLAVQNGQTLDLALLAVPLSLRPAARALVSQALRVHGAAHMLLQQHLRKPLPDPVQALLLISMAQCPPLCQLVAHAQPRAVHTVLHQTVAALRQEKSLRKWQGLHGVVNGVLRNVQRQAQSHLEYLQERWPTAVAAPPVSLSVPRYLMAQVPLWWLARLQADWPQQWSAHLEASNQAPALHVRVAGYARDAVHSALDAAGISYTVLGREGLWLSARAPTPTDLPGFASGALSVQDGAAQLAAPLLLAAMNAIATSAAAQARPLRILDACAAPGGKTLHLLQLLGQGQATSGVPQTSAPAITLLALDIDAARLKRVASNIARARTWLNGTLMIEPLHPPWQLQAADAAAPQSWWDGEPFAAILLDAPCTGSGVLRRHPDMPLLRREQDIAQLAVQQARLLARLWPCLRDGGVLLYCVCSVFKDEAENQIAAFVTSHADARALLQWRFWAGAQQQAHVGEVPNAAWAASLQEIMDNSPHDHDGFYYALLQKYPADAKSKY